MAEHHEGMGIWMGDCHIDIGGTTRYIVVRGKKRWFEMHRWFGPIPTRKNGDYLVTDWPKYVYDAVDIWESKGKRMDGDECVWENGNE